MTIQSGILINLQKIETNDQHYGEINEENSQDFPLEWASTIVVVSALVYSVEKKSASFKNTDSQQLNGNYVNSILYSNVHSIIILNKFLSLISIRYTKW